MQAGARGRTMQVSEASDAATILASSGAGENQAQSAGASRQIPSAAATPVRTSGVAGSGPDGAASAASLVAGRVQALGFSDGAGASAAPIRGGSAHGGPVYSREWIGAEQLGGRGADAPEIGERGGQARDAARARPLVAPDYMTRQQDWFGNSKDPGPGQLLYERFGISARRQDPDRLRSSTEEWQGRMQQDLQARAEGEATVNPLQRSVPRWAVAPASSGSAQEPVRRELWSAPAVQRHETVSSHGARAWREWDAYAAARRQRGGDTVLARGAMASDTEGETSCGE